MLVTVVVHLKGYYEETSPARSSHHQIEEDDKMKINHVWPLLISINPIWRPIRHNFEFSSWYNAQWTWKWLVPWAFMT